MRLARLYAIIDRKLDISFSESTEFFASLLDSGVTLFQYRNKTGSPSELLSEARELKRMASRHLKHDEIRVIMNDRADLGIGGGVDGVHVGQCDLSVEGARSLFAEPRIVGVSTHNLEQLEAANESSADYIAFGPIFTTSSKADPDPVVGIEGLRQARRRTRKPLVAIGGITPENCRQVIDAGADSVAVISALALNPKCAAEEFLRRLT